MNPNEPKFNPVEHRGKAWIYNGLPYKEICRNNAQPAPVVCIISQGFCSDTTFNHSTTLDVPLAVLKEP